MSGGGVANEKKHLISMIRTDILGNDRDNCYARDLTKTDKPLIIQNELNTAGGAEMLRWSARICPFEPDVDSPTVGKRNEVNKTRKCLNDAAVHTDGGIFDCSKETAFHMKQTAKLSAVRMFQYTKGRKYLNGIQV